MYLFAEVIFLLPERTEMPAFGDSAQEMTFKAAVIEVTDNSSIVEPALQNTFYRKTSHARMFDIKALYIITSAFLCERITEIL